MRVALDADALRREMGRRGLTGAEFAAVAGLSAATLSHAMTGRQVDHGTLRKLARALTLTPVMPGIDSLIPTKTETAAASTTATVPSEAQRVSAESPDRA
jgi:transcriptional regulator with XRE-family HTH domain